ncbi:GTP-binding protein [Suillus paluster]|uniref:GTP-binding protein n=1 Tax=Suillus paluster TaxID=48578 RepID=UPI001B880F0F|nr:GTP-binding protein [Suillus paluster]KAG1745913.1 GTP-binding protein [Suillus paluster]
MAPKIDPQNLRETFGRFRVLIVGRANAGKTTILQKVCNTTDKPEIYDAKGRKIGVCTICPMSMHALMDAQRGNHEITNEMVFKSNPGFVFHDSCGFEAGSEKEFEEMKKFISERANATKLEERLHAIWYCFPMDDHSRTFQRSEEKFFSECNTGNVPIIAVFTKCDALHPVALGELENEFIGLSDEEYLKRIPKCVKELINKTRVCVELRRLNNLARPKAEVYLENMDEPNTNCDTLVERTAFALDDEELQLCLVSTQQSNLELCIKCAVG